MTCHPERKGPQTLFSFRGPRRQVFACGVEFGGGESKDLRLHFGIYATNFRDRSLECIDICGAQRREPFFQFEERGATHAGVPTDSQFEKVLRQPGTSPAMRRQSKGRKTGRVQSRPASVNRLRGALVFSQLHEPRFHEDALEVRWPHVAQTICFVDHCRITISERPGFMGVGAPHDFPLQRPRSALISGRR